MTEATLFRSIRCAIEVTLVPFSGSHRPPKPMSVRKCSPEGAISVERNVRHCIIEPSPFYHGRADSTTEDCSMAGNPHPVTNAIEEPLADAIREFSRDGDRVDGFGRAYSGGVPSFYLAGSRVCVYTPSFIPVYGEGTDLSIAPQSGAVGAGSGRRSLGAFRWTRASTAAAPPPAPPSPRP